MVYMYNQDMTRFYQQFYNRLLCFEIQPAIYNNTVFPNTTTVPVPV